MSLARYHPATLGPFPRGTAPGFGLGSLRPPWDRGAETMLFMVIERFRPGQAPAVYRRFRDQGRKAPDGVRYISSWVDLNYHRCFQVVDADHERLLQQWTANWSDLIDFELIPVRTSREAAAAIAPVL